MTTKKIEDGIRAYLDSLGKSKTPKRTVDREAIKALRDQIKKAADPIEKLKLLAALADERKGKVSEADNSGLEAVFVAEAKAWADEEGIPVSAFQAMKVTDDVLKRAGFSLTVAKPSERKSGTRAPRLGLEEVSTAISTLGDSWKLADLAAKIGRDAATTRNYVNKLVEAGTVKIVGDDPKHDGRGRAAKLYAMV